MRRMGLARQLAANRQFSQEMHKVNGIYMPTMQTSKMPWCRKCRRQVDAAFIEERGPDPDFPRWFEVRVKCHGEEDYGRVECRGRQHPDHWATVLSTGQFFQGHEDHGFSAGGLDGAPGKVTLT